MAEGWLIMFKGRHFKVGIEDQEEAVKQVTKLVPEASGLMILPLKNGERDQIGLAEGEVRETTGS
jgi:hypothetical protein